MPAAVRHDCWGLQGLRKGLGIQWGAAVWGPAVAWGWLGVEYPYYDFPECAVPLQCLQCFTTGKYSTGRLWREGRARRWVRKLTA